MALTRLPDAPSDPERQREGIAHGGTLHVGAVHDVFRNVGRPAHADGVIPLAIHSIIQLLWVSTMAQSPYSLVMAMGVPGIPYTAKVSIWSSGKARPHAIGVHDGQACIGPDDQRHGRVDAPDLDGHRGVRLPSEVFLDLAERQDGLIPARQLFHEARWARPSSPWG